jgi:hypothetical protein
LKEFTGHDQELGEVVTLKDALKMYGDSDKVISYLKVSKQVLTLNLSKLYII